MKRHETGEADGLVVEIVPSTVDEACGFFEERARETLQKRGLADATAGEWYDLGRCVGVYEDLFETTGKHTVHRVARELPALFTWPVETETTAEALSALTAGYETVHRGDAGHFDFEQEGEEQGTLVCNIPYPAPVVTGMLSGIGRQFTDSGHLTATRDDTRSTAETDVFVVEWWNTTDIETSGHHRPSASETAGAQGSLDTPGQRQTGDD